MHGTMAWFARHPVAANLLMAFILISGGMSLINTRQEVLPDIPMDMISVSVPYLGAAPEEVEEGVCVRIEEAIQGVEGIKRLTSSAAEGMGTVTAELHMGEDPAEVLDEIKNLIDAIDTFPEQTETPIIKEMTSRLQVVNLAVHGFADEASLKRIAERLRDEVSALDGITSVALINVKPYEISIEVSEEIMRRHGLSFDEVVAAVRRSSLDLPGGSLRTRGGEILLRTKGQAYVGRDFESLILLTQPDGSRLTLGDLAQVKDGFAETDQISRFDGEPAVVLEIYRVGEQDAIEIANTVQSWISEARASLPEGISLTVWQDQTKVLKDRLSLLARNGLTGLVLVFFLLAFFLRFRLAVWVTIGIPISFLGTFWIMPGFDVTTNLISLFAFIVVLGIVVDDAIVVGENIHSHQERHGNGLRGAIEGAQEVAIPVTFGVMTTIAAFAPMLMVGGSMGKMMKTIPIVVMGCLFFSFIESKWILPRHLVHIPAKKKQPGIWHRFQDKIAGTLQAFAIKIYRPFLERALRHRYITIATGITVLFLTMGLVGGGIVRLDYMENVESDYVSASVTMPLGTPAEQTEAVIRRLEKTAQQMEAELGVEGIFRHVYATVGDQPYRKFQEYNAGLASGNYNTANLGEVTIEMAPAEVRGAISSDKLASRWRELTGEIPDVRELRFSASLFSAGEDINVQVRGEDLDELRRIATGLKAELSRYAGVHEISDSYEEGKREARLQLKPAAENWGINLLDLGRQVRQAFYGEEAQRVQRGREDLRVMVRYPEAQRRSLGDLEGMRIRTPNGMEVPFEEVASFEEGRGYAAIKRVDRQRAINVTAAVDARYTTAGEVLSALDQGVMQELMAAHPKVIFSYEGQMAQQQETMASMNRGFVMSCIIIFALLAIPLRSYIQPLLIMSAIPFGLVGAVFGHIIMGLNLTMLSLLGLIALTGVVVNDSLVLVDFINRHRNDGDDLFESIRDAGVKRFRAILLTSLTTFAGLMPMLAEKSVQAKFMVPMAVSLAFGVLFATVITLVFVSASYWILEDLRGLGRRVFRRKAATPVEANAT